MVDPQTVGASRARPLGIAANERVDAFEIFDLHLFLAPVVLSSGTLFEFFSIPNQPLLVPGDSVGAEICGSLLPWTTPFCSKSVSKNVVAQVGCCSQNMYTWYARYILKGDDARGASRQGLDNKALRMINFSFCTCDKSFWLQD